MNCKNDAEVNTGMLTVGLGVDAIAPFLGNYSSAGRDVWITRFNNPSSVIVSGSKPTLEDLADNIKASGHFVHLLQVDIAYHSPLLGVIGDEYSKLIASDNAFTPLSENNNSGVTMFSSFIAAKKDTPADAAYKKSNMVSPVRFAEALTQFMKSEAPDIIIELGPAGALAGPISQTLKEKALDSGRDAMYWALWARGVGAIKTLLNAVGRL
jgi:acyl transferase domain-containing protein